MKLTEREREESRGKGWEQGAEEPITKRSQKIENGRGRWETWRQKAGKGNGTEKRSRESWGVMEQIEENPTGRGLEGRWVGGAQNEWSLRAGVREAEGDKGDCGEY